MEENKKEKHHESRIKHVNNLVKSDIERNFQNEVSGKIYQQAYEISQKNDTLGETFRKTGNKIDEISTVKDDKSIIN